MTKTPTPTITPATSQRNGFATIPTRIRDVRDAQVPPLVVEPMAEQNKAKVEADTERIRSVILAEQEQSVRLTDANRELEVARIENQAALAQVQAMLAKAEAERDVVKLTNEADAAVLAGRTKAFGSGLNYARYQFYQKVGPRIESVVASDSKDGLGALFLPYLPPAKEGQP